MKVWRALDPSNCPRPRLIWYFEETTIQVGVKIGTLWSDPVAAISGEFEVSKYNAQRLAFALNRVGAAICKLRDHRWERCSTVEKQCGRCFITRPLP